MGFDLGGLIGGALGAIGDIWSTESANSAQADMQRQAYEYQKESMLNRHQWEVEDLRKAGLNPILSATNSAGGTINVGSGQSHKADLGRSISQMMNAFTNSAVGKNAIETNTKNADANVLNAEANHIKALADDKLANSSIDYNKANTEYVKEMTTNVKEFRPLQIEMQKLGIAETQQRMMCALIDLQSLLDLRKKQGDSALMVGSAAMTSSAASYMNAETNRMHLDIDAEMADIARNNQISESAFRAAASGHMDAETKLSLEKLRGAINSNNMTEYLNPRATGIEIKEFGQVVSQLGRYINQINPINGIVQFHSGD